MSLNDIIKKQLPVKKQKLSHANNQYNYCSAFDYQNCSNCKEVKRVKCCKRLIFQSVKQINATRWHLYFTCLANHLAIRWVIIEGNTILAGKIKN